MTSTSNFSGRLGLLLFGLIFLGAGLAAGYFLVLSDFETWIKARSYVAVPAELLDVNLISHRGEETTTYQVQAQYRYNVDGRTYLGKRVGINSGADNIGSYQQDLYASLRETRRRDATVTAWVDPSDANNALLDREMRWGLFGFKCIFFVLFTLIGLAICYGALRKSDPKPKSVETQPWRANPAWQQPRIASTSRNAATAFWFFAIVWNLISSPIPFLLSAELRKGNWPALLGLLFPIVGVWLLYEAIRKTLQWRRFGSLTLTMDPFPGSIGGDVGGVIDIPERFDARQKISVKLTCLHRRASEHQRKRQSMESAVWQNEAQVVPTFSGRGTQVPFRFHVPAGLPPSAEDSHRWVVHVAAEIPGVDLEHDFELPVYESVLPSVSRVATPPASPPEIPASIVRVERRGDATVFEYPACRAVGMSVGLTVFGLIFAGAAAFIATKLEFNLFAIPTWFMMFMVSAFAALLTLGGLYSLVNTLRVDVSARGLTTTRRAFGLTFVKHVSPDDVVDVKTRISSQTNNGRTASVRYALVATTRNGRRVTVGDDIPGHPLAEYLAQQVRDALMRK